MADVNGDANAGHDEPAHEDDDIDSTAAVAGDTEHPDELLLRAAKEGDWTLMEEALQSGANVNAKSKKKHRQTALFRVLLYQHWKTAFRLLEAYASKIDLEAMDWPKGDTALVFACWKGNLAMVQTLVSLGANLQHRNYRGKTALHNACKKGKHEIVALLLDHQPDATHAILGAKNYRGDTPLHMAARYADARMIRLLLDRAVGSACLSVLNEQNHKLETALHSAVQTRHSDGQTGAAIVEELTLRGADISLQDVEKSTPFDVASTYVAMELCWILLKSYRNQMLERDGDLALHSIFREAAYVDYPQEQTFFRVQLAVGALTVHCFRTLLRSFDTARLIRSRHPGTGFMPVHVACSQGAPAEILQILVHYDLEILQTPSHAGALPLHLACSRGRAGLATLQYLVDQGGPDTLRARDREGALPLHRLLGAKRKRVGLEAVKLLLHAYPKALSVATHSGDLPIMVAGRMSLPLDVLLLLLKASPEVVSL